MSDLPEALRLADALEFGVLLGDDRDAAAAELRRLHKVEADFHMDYRMKCDAELKKLQAERDALLAVLKDAVECDGGDDGLFHACCGESFWTPHDVKCWVPKAKAAIDAARSKT